MPGGGKVEEINKSLASSQNSSQETSRKPIEESKDLSLKNTTDVGDQNSVSVNKFVQKLLKEQKLDADDKFGYID